MQLQKPYSTLEGVNNSSTSFELPLISQITFIPFQQLRKLFHGLSINQKIGYGYALVLGIAVFGTGSGLTVGDYYQHQAKEQLEYAYQQQNLLNDLQKEVLVAKFHVARLAPMLGNSVWLESETIGFFESVLRVQTLLSDLKEFQKTAPPQSSSSHVEILELLKTYEQTVEAYAVLVNSLLQKINPQNLQPEEVEQARSLLQASLNSKASIQFEELSQQLNQIISASKTQGVVAKAAFNQAERLRMQITIFSMVLSVTIAAILAYYTSRAIARPLKWVTHVANRVTQQSNYHLRAPVLTQDEAGLLATSLNQLIERMSQQLQELKQTQTQLIQTEKMSSLGLMVAGIAHEINNPVNFIYGNLDYTHHYVQDLMNLVFLYQATYPKPTPAIQTKIEEIDFEFLCKDLPKVLGSMKGGAERIRHIVASLRNFSRLDEAEMKRVNIHEGIDSTLLILNHRLYPPNQEENKQIKIVKHYGNLPAIECYPGQLNQVFLNIITNALDALEESQEKELQEAEKFLGNDATNHHLPTITIKTEKLDSERICIRIRNNRSFIPPELKGKLFDPFFTTKAPGKGTGLGLAIAYQIIAKHQGEIEVTSELSQGVEFAVTLPIKPY